MTDSYYQDFMKYFRVEDRENSVRLVLGWLDRGEIDVVSLYNRVLTPALYDVASLNKQQEISIWQEHIRSSIVRTIVECCYPFVLEQRDALIVNRGLASGSDENKAEQKNQATKEPFRVVIICPEEEYHEIGARMAADFFTICGYDAIFLGGNTPREDFITSLVFIKPRYVAVSVTNYYHTFAAEKLIKKIRCNLDYQPVILAGGYVFINNPELSSKIGADYLVNTFAQIKQLAEGEYNETGI